MSTISLLTSEKSFLSCLKNTLKHFGQGEGHQSVRKEEEEFIRSIFGKEKGAFLGTGRAEMKAFVTEGTKELFLTFRIGAWFWFHPVGMKTHHGGHLRYPAGTFGLWAALRAPPVP